MLIGHAIGKYGIDILAPATGIKSIATYRKLKDANRICELESMALSSANKETIISSSLKHAADREAYFKNVKIHWDRQNKHIPGNHNFESNKGRILLNPNELEFIVKESVGKGQRVVGNIGEAGYRERVDFGKIIGEYALRDGNKPVKYFSTTKGIIHYSSDGFIHVIPSNPEAVIK